MENHSQSAIYLDNVSLAFDDGRREQLQHFEEGRCVEPGNKHEFSISGRHFEKDSPSGLIIKDALSNEYHAAPDDFAAALAALPERVAEADRMRERMSENAEKVIVALANIRRR